MSLQVKCTDINCTAWYMFTHIYAYMCIHPDWDIGPFCHFWRLPLVPRRLVPLKDNCYSDLYHHRLVLLALDLDINTTIQHVLFCVLILSFNMVCWFIIFHCRVVFHCMTAPQFIYFFFCWLTFGLFPVVGYREQCCYEHYCTNLLVHVFLLGMDRSNFPFFIIFL